MEPQYNAALKDIGHGVANWEIWGRLGWLDIKRRYRRTVIGPFWTTISLGIFIVILGIVWAHLWKQDPKSYLPFLCSGYLVWVMIAAIISEGCAVFFSAEGLIRQLRFPYTTLVCAVIWRNVIAFFHNLIIFVFVGLYAGIKVTWATFLFLPGLVLVVLSGMWVVMLLGLVCSRFRDIQQVILSILQVSMFVTPIFWSPEQLGQRFFAFVDYNVLYHYVDIVRSPLLGQVPTAWSWVVTSVAAILGWAVTFFVYSRFRWRIPYWI